MCSEIEIKQLRDEKQRDRQLGNEERFILEIKEEFGGNLRALLSTAYYLINEKKILSDKEDILKFFEITEKEYDTYSKIKFSKL